MGPSTPRGDSSSPTCAPDRIGLSQLPCRRPCGYVQGFYPEALPDGPRIRSGSLRGKKPAEIVVLLPRGATISGTRRGRTRSAAVVRVGQRCRNRVAGGRTRVPVGFAPSLGARTDDNGSFRLFGLQAGEPSSWRSHHPVSDQHDARRAAIKATYPHRLIIPPPSPQPMPADFASGRARISGRLTSSSNDRAWSQSAASSSTRPEPPPGASRSSCRRRHRRS